MKRTLRTAAVNVGVGGKASPTALASEKDRSTARDIAVSFFHGKREIFTAPLSRPPTAKRSISACASAISGISGVGAETFEGGRRGTACASLRRVSATDRAWRATTPRADPNCAHLVASRSRVRSGTLLLRGPDWIDRGLEAVYRAEDEGRAGCIDFPLLPEGLASSTRARALSRTQRLRLELLRPAL